MLYPQADLPLGCHPQAGLRGGLRPKSGSKSMNEPHRGGTCDCRLAGTHPWRLG